MICSPYRTGRANTTSLAQPSNALQRIFWTCFWRLTIWWRDRTTLPPEQEVWLGSIGKLYPTPPKNCWIHWWKKDGEPFIYRIYKSDGHTEYAFPEKCSRCNRTRKYII